MADKTIPSDFGFPGSCRIIDDEPLIAGMFPGTGWREFSCGCRARLVGTEFEYCATCLVEKEKAKVCVRRSSRCSRSG